MVFVFAAMEFVNIIVNQTSYYVSGAQVGLVAKSLSLARYFEPEAGSGMARPGLYNHINTLL